MKAKISREIGELECQKWLNMTSLIISYNSLLGIKIKEKYYKNNFIIKVQDLWRDILLICHIPLRIKVLWYAS